MSTPPTHQDTHQEPNQTKALSFTKAEILKFILPSLFGLLLFVTPVSYEGNITIPIAVLSKALQALLAKELTTIVLLIIGATALASIVTKLFRPKFILESKFLNSLFNVTPAWFVIRLLGLASIVMVYFKLGPEAIWSEATGGLVLADLLPVLFSVFIFAGLLLPLLVSFGLLEFLGTMLTKIMRPLFKLPGRAAIDCMASWLGDGSVGILLTSKQYEKKHYTQKEAAIIGTTFSAVSITFSLVVISQVKLEHLFVPFYLAVCAAGVAAALIVPRLPPLSRKRDQLIDGSERCLKSQEMPEDLNVFSWGLAKAVGQAKKAGGPLHILREGAKNVLDMLFGILPVVMAVGTAALMVAEFTPIFDYLGRPFVPLLDLMRVPEAQEASKTLVIGFADMFVPSILAASIQSEMTRFIIAAVSVTQLIYLSEVGALMLGSKIPVSIWELFMIFILRTLVTLPVITLIAHMIF